MDIPEAKFVEIWTRIRSKGRFRFVMALGLPASVLLMFPFGLFGLIEATPNNPVLEPMWVQIGAGAILLGLGVLIGWAVWCMCERMFRRCQYYMNLMSETPNHPPEAMPGQRPPSESSPASGSPQR